MATSTIVALAFLFLALFAARPEVVADYVIHSDSSESFLPGQNLTYDMSHHIPFGPITLAFQHDCNIVRYEFGKPTWSTNTSRANGSNCYLTILSDREVVLRNNFHYPVWRSNVKSSIPGSYVFVVVWDGALAVFGPEIWSNTNETTLSDPYPMLTSTDYLLYSHTITPVSLGVVVAYKNFELRLHQDCNLAVEDTNDGRVMWQTKTYSPYGDCFVTLDAYGELFVKHKRREILWRSGKRQSEPAIYPQSQVLLLGYDGRVVIYAKPIWYLPATNARLSSIAHKGYSRFAPRA